MKIIIIYNYQAKSLMFKSIKLVLVSLLMLLSSLFISSPSIATEIDIFDAAREGNLSSITEYVQQDGNLNITNSSGYTPFILATYHGQDKAAAMLVDSGANACLTDSKGNNVYMGVAFKGYVHIAEWLLDNTACDINHRNNAGQTALMMASLFGREELVKLLLQHGADPEIVDYQNNTAESLAQGQGLNQIIKIIRFNLR